MQPFSPTRRRILLAAPGMLLGSCGGTSTAETPGNSRVQDAIVKLDEYAERTRASSGVPGMAIAVVHQGQVLHLKGYGLRKAGKCRPRR